MMHNIRRTFHVVPERGQTWSIKMEGVRLSIATFPSREHTIEVAREIAGANQKGQLVIHGADGRVERNIDFGEGVPAQ